MLYTRNRCPLCDKAKKIILELQENFEFIYNEIDIDTSDELTERYGLMIPVVEINGVEAGYGQIDKISLEEVLEKRMSKINVGKI